jgi:hypothetical protein
MRPETVDLATVRAGTGITVELDGRHDHSQSAGARIDSEHTDVLRPAAMVRAVARRLRDLGGNRRAAGGTVRCLWLIHTRTQPAAPAYRENEIGERRAGIGD